MANKKHDFQFCSENLSVVEIFSAVVETSYSLPLFNTTIPAGCPSTADEHVEVHLDLNDFMVSHPSATFFVKVEGESMRDAGILSGSMLVVDRSLTPTNGRIVVALLDGEFTVKRLLMEKGEVFLAPENPAFLPIKISSESLFQIWGVVTFVISKP